MFDWTLRVMLWTMAFGLLAVAICGCSSLPPAHVVKMIDLQAQTAPVLKARVNSSDPAINAAFDALIDLSYKTKEWSHGRPITGRPDESNGRSE